MLPVIGLAVQVRDGDTDGSLTLREIQDGVRKTWEPYVANLVAVERPSLRVVGIDSTAASASIRNAVATRSLIWRYQAWASVSSAAASRW
ncbi:hypothetical protein Mal64_05720 [Pseudobythopirellula maris]|uniref:Uncharacterized protein n=1 Tax=Pseudobythopirellula maris TaxID=2527991 RepID=A0A5C5ZSZ8_9BACT|nr:hypothetical protein [Pseudobythopirellula maris]TWT90188.1 hypothetical protein Mal64_05720 [Pseudobythopirellula maris]